MESQFATCSSPTGCAEDTPLTVQLEQQSTNLGYRRGAPRVTRVLPEADCAGWELDGRLTQRVMLHGLEARGSQIGRTFGYARREGLLRPVCELASEVSFVRVHLAGGVRGRRSGGRAPGLRAHRLGLRPAVEVGLREYDLGRVGAGRRRGLRRRQWRPEQAGQDG